MTYGDLNLRALRKLAALRGPNSNADLELRCRKVHTEMYRKGVRKRAS